MLCCVLPCYIKILKSVQFQIFCSIEIKGFLTLELSMYVHYLGPSNNIPTNVQHGNSTTTATKFTSHEPIYGIWEKLWQRKKNVLALCLLFAFWLSCSFLFPAFCFQPKVTIFIGYVKVYDF